MSRKNSRRRSAHNYQTLESRQMLASIAFDTGVVVVRGSAGDDVIELIGSNDFQSFTVRVNDDPTLTESFQYADVSTVLVDAFAGNDRVTNSLLVGTTIAGGPGDDILQGGFLNDTLSGSRGADILIGRNGDDLLFGGDGNDSLFGGNGEDQLSGLNGNDLLFGGSGNDLLEGGDGNDSLQGEAGNDRIFGEQGDDLLIGNSGEDRLNGGEGNDRHFGGNDDDLIVGGLGDDRIQGNAGDDLLNGNEGDDIISAGLGDDTVNGGTGLDRILGVDGINTLNGNGGNDSIFGGIGADRIVGGSGDDLLSGGSGDDLLSGGLGVDTLFGGTDDDTLAGGSGDDFLSGQEGDDRLFGEEGVDTQFGNDGNDRFFSPNNNERINGGAGVDEMVHRGTSQSEFRLDRVGSDIRFTDLRIPDSLFYLGPVTLTSIEQLDLLTGQDPLLVESLFFPEADRRITVQPIIAADNDGSNAANGFGTAEQEAEIKRRIDNIFKQAGIDVEFLPTVQFNNTFVNSSGDGNRPIQDFDRIFTVGDAAGVGSSDPTVIDFYFVSRVPGFSEPVITSHGGGRGFLRSSGATMSVGDVATNRESGRGAVAHVIAHEIGHNLGLSHTSQPTLLSIRTQDSDLLDQGQINVARQSNLTRSISGNDSTAGASRTVPGDSRAASPGLDVGHVHFHGDGHDHTGGTGDTGDTGGCDCGVCGFCTGGNPA